MSENDTMFLCDVEPRLKLLERVVEIMLRTVDRSKLSREEKFTIETFTYLTWTRSHVQ